jgi:hypothetical protein
MTMTLRACALGALLAGAAALIAPPASANSLQNEGNFGGTWSRIGPSSSYGRHRHAGRVEPLYGRGYYSPSYAYAPYDYYGPGYYGPGFAIGGPGFGVGIGVY